MALKIDSNTWVYVLIQNPGTDDRIVGQMDTENDIAFIPMFMDKEAANQGVLHIAKKKGNKYEIQAIIFEDLEAYAAEGRFILFVIDEDGKIIDKRAPYQSS